MLKWIKEGFVVTKTRYAEAVEAGLPKEAMARIWKRNTFNGRDISIIETAIKNADIKVKTAIKKKVRT